ncbi:MAG: hypothetical protein HOY76_09630 [Streptomyces sp.]|nr:hypothetical protein [Streptomyces sp.]
MGEERLATLDEECTRLVALGAARARVLRAGMAVEAPGHSACWTRRSEPAPPGPAS